MGRLLVLGRRGAVTAEMGDFSLDTAHSRQPPSTLQTCCSPSLTRPAAFAHHMAASIQHSTIPTRTHHPPSPAVHARLPGRPLRALLPWLIRLAVLLWLLLHAVLPGPGGRLLLRRPCALGGVCGGVLVGGWLCCVVELLLLLADRGECVQVRLLRGEGVPLEAAGGVVLHGGGGCRRTWFVFL